MLVADLDDLYPGVAVLAVLSPPSAHHRESSVPVMSDAVGSDPERSLLSTIQPVGLERHRVLAGLANNPAILDPPA